VRLLGSVSWLSGIFRAIATKGMTVIVVINWRGTILYIQSIGFIY
jgi:hypothetical protein